MAGITVSSVLTVKAKKQLASTITIRIPSGIDWSKNSEIKSVIATKEYIYEDTKKYAMHYGYGTDVIKNIDIISYFIKLN
jgi:hypothetical protein